MRPVLCIDDFASMPAVSIVGECCLSMDEILPRMIALSERCKAGLVMANFSGPLSVFYLESLRRDFACSAVIYYEVAQSQSLRFPVPVEPIGNDGPAIYAHKKVEGTFGVIERQVPVLRCIEIADTYYHATLDLKSLVSFDNL